MKIRKVTPDLFPKVSALLRQACPGEANKALIIETLRNNNKPIHEWVCIHINRVIAYIAFSNAYKGHAVCGLHLSLLVVKPEFQSQGIGSELLRYSLRREVIKESPIFVLGPNEFYCKFGFEPCSNPTCRLKEKNHHFLSLGNRETDTFTVGYEPEFSIIAKKRDKLLGGKRRKKR